MIDRKILYLSLIFIFGIAELAYSGGNPPGQPFQYLQQQIDELKNQLVDLQNSSIPPTISYDSSCDGISLNITLKIRGTKEIAYYAIQEQGGDPPTNIITFVEPGLTNVDYTFTLDSGGSRTLLFMASDISGNTSKLLHTFDLNICSGPSDPCANNPCGQNSICTTNGQFYTCGCASSYGNCDTDWLNGCEINLSTDANNCGRCNNVCGPGQACVGGQCTQIQSCGEIAFARIIYPATLSVVVGQPSAEVYGEAFIPGVTELVGPTPCLNAQLGYGPTGSDPRTQDWIWIAASYNMSSQFPDDEYLASLSSSTAGSYDYVYRFSTTNGASWVYADLNGIFLGVPANPGKLTVVFP